MAVRRNFVYGLGMFLLVLVGVVAWCEYRGWPFLKNPVQNFLSQKLGRDVRMEATPKARAFALHLWGEFRLELGRLVLANTSWGKSDYLVQAEQATLVLTYGDVWRFLRGAHLRVEDVLAQSVSLRLERRENGQANWVFDLPQDPDKKNSVQVEFANVQIKNGDAHIQDKIIALDLKSTFVLDEQSQTPGPTQDKARPDVAFSAQATGTYQNNSLKAQFKAGHGLPWLTNSENAPALPVQLDVSVGQASLAFNGTVKDILAQKGLQGRYTLRGASLASVGEIFNVTLPTTNAFLLRGNLNQIPSGWATQVSTAQIGKSNLTGQFEFTKPNGSAKPNLNGNLKGTLWLQDLGPAVGLPRKEEPVQTKTSDRVLPDRDFDLPSLKAMNANVQIGLDQLELGTQRLSSIKPFRARIKLQEGKLTLTEIDARMAQGRISGQMELDAGDQIAFWKTNLLLQDIQLEEWVAQTSETRKVPYASGKVGMKLDLTGQGRSTADLLATSQGRALFMWTQGSLSHLVVEAAGLDIAQAIGIVLRGDEQLPVTCGVGDFVVAKGNVTPRLLVIDTRDSTLWVEGQVSMTTEKMDLVAHVAPKDVTPLSLRSPVQIGGFMGKPDVSIEKKGLFARLLPAALLATVNPLAAIIPLIDFGDDEAKKQLAACQTQLKSPVFKRKQ